MIQKINRLLCKVAPSRASGLLVEKVLDLVYETNPGLFRPISQRMAAYRAGDKSRGPIPLIYKELRHAVAEEADREMDDLDRKIEEFNNWSRKTLGLTKEEFNKL